MTQCKRRLQILDHSNKQSRGVSLDLFLAFSPDETSLCRAYKYIEASARFPFWFGIAKGVLVVVLKGKEKATLLGEASVAFVSALNSCMKN